MTLKDDLRFPIWDDDGIYPTVCEATAVSQTPGIAIDYLAKRFIDDKGLLAIYLTAYQKIGHAKFARNHGRVLEAYYMNVDPLAQTPSERSAVELLCSKERRSQISRAILE